MTRATSVFKWLWLTTAPAALGCQGDDVPSQESAESSSSLGADASSGDEASTALGSSSMSADETSTTTSSSSSSSSSGTEESSTGEPEATESIALRILATDAADNRAFFRYRVEDLVADGPTQLQPPSTDDSEVALHFPERRMVYWSRGDAGDDLWLGSLDDPLPSDTIQLDTAPISDTAALSLPIAVPGEEAVVFVDAEANTAYRVDFPDGVPGSPIAIAHGVDGGDPRLRVGPIGHYLLFDTIRDATGVSDIARASLVAPDPDAVDVLSDLFRGNNASLVGLTPTGDGVFMWFGQSDPPLHYVDTSGAQATSPVRIVSPLPPKQEGSYALTAVHPTRAGVIYSTTGFDGDGAVRWIGMAGGIPQPAITLIDGASPVGRGIVWAADGSLLLFSTFDGIATYELHAVQFDAGLPGAPISVAVYDGIDEAYDAFMMDSEYLYLQHELPGSGAELLRRPIFDRGLGDPEVVVPDQREAGFDEVLAVHDGTLLYHGRSGDQEALYTIDVSGVVPAEPVLVDDPLPQGEGFGPGRFSPAGEFVAYEVRDDGFEPGRLMLVHRDARGEALEVTDSVIDWAFAPNW